MSRYRKVDVRVWNDERFRPFSDDGKLAFLFVLTHPHLTSLGAMRGTLGGLAAELRWSTKRLRTAIAPAARAKMVEVNEAAAYIGLPNFLRYNEPEGPNSVKRAWLEALDSIPECTEKRALILRCRKYLDGKSPEFKKQLGEAIWEAFSDAMGDDITHTYRDASPIQEQEQEPEQESPSSPPWGRERQRPERPPGSSTAFEQFWAAYPRKVGKDAARQVWDRKRPDLAQVLAAIDRQQRSAEWQAEAGRFIPHPKTWLNQGRWQDEPPTSSPPNEDDDDDAA